jgi:hypothetical protein
MYAISSSNPIHDFDLGFLPSPLTRQGRLFIKSYHALDGCECLPDILWKLHLGAFIAAHDELARFLQKASTARSAKKAQEGFLCIATIILSVEILVSGFAGWSAIYPEAADRARAILKNHDFLHSQRLPLLDFYIYLPKYTGKAAILTLTPAAGLTPETGDCSHHPRSVFTAR